MHYLERIDRAEDISALIKPRPADSHKGTFGHALLIAGSYGMAGASVLASKAALRSGLGLLSVRVPECNRVILQTAVPEAMALTDSCQNCFSEPVSSERYQAVGIGPGLGTSEIAAHALEQQLMMTNVPMVLDADALNIISKNPLMLELIPEGSILTPHPKEFARLTHEESDVEGRRELAADFAKRHKVTIILKGAPSAVLSSEGICYICTTGNSGMATAGSGDVLTGIVLALLTQGYGAVESARIANHIHGLAGDLAAEQLGQTAMTSADIASFLPEAWKRFEKTEKKVIR